MSAPALLVSCPNDKVGDESDTRWMILVAVAHRRRADRVSAAKRVLRSRSRHITHDHRDLMRGIVSGEGDLILQKLREHGYEDEDA